MSSVSKILLACEMVRPELEFLMDKTGFDCKVVWMEKSLHDYPDKLRVGLQEEIDKWDGKYDYIMLAYGLCGNGLIGVKSSHSSLVIPNFDDCIRVLLSQGPGNPITYNPRALMYTSGWSDTEEGVIAQYKKYTGNYGEKKGTKVLKLMYKNYTDFEFFDTGLYDIEKEKEALSPVVEDVLGLKFSERKVKLDAYEKFLSGEWDEEVIVTKPGDTVTDAHFANRARCIF